MYILLLSHIVRTPTVGLTTRLQSEVPERWRAAELSRVHVDNEMVSTTLPGVIYRARQLQSKHVVTIFDLLS